MSDPRPLHRNPDYLLLWGAQVVSTFGSMSTSVVYPLLVLSITASPTAAGLVLALRSLPYLLLSLPGGALVDRWDRKRVMIVCDVGRALAIATIPVAMGLDVLTFAQLCIVATLEGSFFVFFNLAEVAALPRVVAAGRLPQAAALNDAAFSATAIVAPSIGTALFQSAGRAVPFVVDVCSYLVSAAALARIRTPFHETRVVVPRALKDEIVEGLRWLWGHPLIRYMAFVTGGLNFIGAAAPLVLIVIARQAGASDFETGLIFTIGGVGGVLGSLVGGRVQRRFSFGQVIVAVLWLDALLLPLYLVTTRVVYLGAIFAAISFTGPIYNVVQFSYRVASIPDALQGRVNSTFRLLAFGLMPPGALCAGLLLERAGVAVTVAVFAAWSLLLAIATTANRAVREARPIAAAG